MLSGRAKPRASKRGGIERVLSGHAGGGEVHGEWACPGKMQAESLLIRPVAEQGSMEASSWKASV